MIKVTVSKGTRNGIVSLDPWSKAFSATSHCHTEKEVARLKGTGHITLQKLRGHLVLPSEWDGGFPSWSHGLHHAPPRQPLLPRAANRTISADVKEKA